MQTGGALPLMADDGFLMVCCSPENRRDFVVPTFEITALAGEVLG